MATYVIYADTTDGFIVSEHASTYSTARAGSGTLNAYTAGANHLSAGQTCDSSSGGTYYVNEGFLQFDTSVIAGETVLTATLDLYGNTNWSGVDFTVNARLHDWGTALTTADFVAGASLSGKTLLATLATSAFTTSGYNTFTSDGAFPANVNTAGSTRLLLSSSRTESNTTPAGSFSAGSATDERVYFQAADTSGTSQDPKLTVTTATAVTATVTSDAVLASNSPTKTTTSDALLFVAATKTATSDSLLELGTRKLTRTVVGESATGNVRIFGATAGQAYRVYNSGGTVLESAVADSNGKVQFTSAVNSGTYIVGFTDNTYATRISGQWWRGTVATGNVYSADPALIPAAGINVLATDASYYYGTSQFGSRGQIVQTDTKQFIVYRTGGAGSSFGAADGNEVVIRVDRATGLVDQGPFTLHSGISEGHELYCIARAPNGKLRFVYGGQNDYLYMRESSSADDITSWSSATSLGAGSLSFSFAGNFVIDSDGNNHIVGGTYSGGSIIYGTSTNAAPTSFTWSTIVNTFGTTSTGYGVLFGDYVLYESGGVKKHMICFGSYDKSAAFGTTGSYRYAYYLSSSDGFATIKKADGTSAGSVPLSYSSSLALTGPDQVSSLYHNGGWLKIAQVAGNPYLLLDNDRNNLPASNVPGVQSVSSWNGSAWSNHSIPDLPMWFTSPHTNDTQDSRDVVNANWGVNIQSRGSLVYVYAAVGYCTLSSLDTGHTGFRLLRFKSSDGFATYTTDQMVAEGYGGFTYTDLYDGGSKRGVGIWAAGFGYPKVPDDPATVLFSIVDKDYATIAVSSLTLTEVTSDAVLRLSPTKTVTSNAVLSATRTTTVASDAVLGSTRVLALTSNAVLSTTTTTRTVTVASNARLGVPGSNPYIVGPTTLSSSQFGSASMDSAQFGSSGISPSTQQPIS